MTKKLAYGVCRFCGCTQEKACVKSVEGKTAFGCSWTDPTRRACTSCVPTAKELWEMFMLVKGGGKDPIPTVKIVEFWNDEEKHKVMKILSRIHLEASDNVVLGRRVTVPKVARRFLR